MRMNIQVLVQFMLAAMGMACVLDIDLWKKYTFKMLGKIIGVIIISIILMLVKF